MEGRQVQLEPAIEPEGFVAQLVVIDRFIKAEICRRIEWRRDYVGLKAASFVASAVTGEDHLIVVDVIADAEVARESTVAVAFVAARDVHSEVGDHRRTGASKVLLGVVLDVREVLLFVGVAQAA